jgi:hypothetical protein
MNRETGKTALFVGVAGALALLAAVTQTRPRAAELFSDQGQTFHPDFTEPLKATAIEAIEPDEGAGGYHLFKVQVVDGKWSIPSHHNYPADGKDRLSKTASALIGLKKDRVQSDNSKDHEALGVVDPLDQASGKGRGKRVRLYDAAGSILADVIFGKEAGEGRRYVRLADQKRTYAVKTDLDLSTKFEDWVETDLLQITQDSVRKVVIDKYSFDETQKTIKDRSTHFVARDDGGADWKVGEIKEGEEVNTETVSTLLNTLDDLKLVGVRPKPRVVAQAKDLNELGKLTRQELLTLAHDLFQRGFFIMQDKDRYLVVSNEGEVQAACNDGVVYTLRFGEVLVGSGEEISAGKDEEKKDPKKEEKKGSTENRYLFVSTGFDESLLGAPPAEPKPLVADPARKPEEQKADEEKAKQAKEEYEKKKKDFDQKKEDGRKRADKLTARFSQWYYVIPADAFKKLRVDRAQLVKPKEPPKDEKKK